MYKLHQWLLLLLFTSIWHQPAAASCDSYSPAFPLPKLDPESKVIRGAQHKIESALKKAIRKAEYDTTSFSIAVTSSTETLFELHHTAKHRDEVRPGAAVIDGDSCYRIASCTKTFTVLALLQQEKQGKLNLDDPVSKYIAELNAPQSGTIPWDEITLRTLASQLSGIPRDIAQGEALVDLGSSPWSYGLPPLSPSEHHEAQCDSVTNYTKPCQRSDLLNYLRKATPLFAPKQKSTYSNLNYELLSLVLANVTSTPYEELIQRDILTPLNLTSTTFTRPSDSVAALPKGISYYWDVVMGIQNPTGGLYSSSNDLSQWLRYVLTHYNAVSPSTNWILPSSWSNSIDTFYGMPWEIFRTTDILAHTDRPVTFVTKSGGLPGYSTLLETIPDYGIGITILVAGPASDFLSLAREAIGVHAVQAADEIAQETLAQRYTGTWTAPASRKINSTVTIAQSRRTDGLFVREWFSNGTDVLSQLGSLHFTAANSRRGYGQYLQLVPTLLFKDQDHVQGEVWRLLGHTVPLKSYGAGGKRADDDDDDEKIMAYRKRSGHYRGGRGRGRGSNGVFDNFCITDIDNYHYGAVPVNEVVFWDERDDGTFGTLELTGFRIKLERVDGSSYDGYDDDEGLMVQG